MTTATLRSIALCGLVLPAALLASGSGWKNKPFPNWDDDAVIRLVTDSPWAHAKSVNLDWVKPRDRPFDYKDVPGTTPNGTIKGGSPVGGIGVPKTSLPPRADLIIRWVSALPVRHATALYKLRADKLPNGRLNALIGAPPADYVVEIFGVPAVVAHLGAGVVELEAQRTSQLRTRSGRVINSNKVEIVPQGLTMSIQVHFPNTTPIDLKDDEVEFLTDLQIFHLHEKFKLSQMVYLDHLEL